MLSGFKDEERLHNNAFGCTGGIHRSVVCRNFFFLLNQKKGIEVFIDHRDLKS